MRSFMTACAVFALGCGAARAPVATSFEDLPGRLESGKRVTIDDVAGQLRQGTLVRVEPDRIVFSNEGIQTVLKSTEVRQVTACCDPVANGAAIGFGIGVVAGFFTLGATANPFQVTTNQVVLGLVIGGALGAAAGAGVDASTHTDEIVYQAPGLTVALRGSPSRPTVNFTFRW
jgi:hypothetical protein